ncbi:uracil-DNA glycosylase family protein [Amphritea sp. 2_MG-2023]|uniref:uracil-DNA glycosylase family protein n=1 Tax=Amphritea TaxID=515417 RepID=UPI001C074496|nr:uracil-DNA glycosylase family protein [Amphritea sp. 2_MG-2023]MBU2965689.1 uracil-DNA glycosylase family protein [Amphritea atlantica]MDO6417245.1 uracil-DNA glycosylase family protein [Amphritea sp. 2_MG-2023]
MESDQQLIARVKACDICAPYLPDGVRPVIQFDSAARILIAAQAPGRRVHETGIPFNDPSGERLRAWMGITAETFYDAKQLAILPMGFCYPGTGKSGDLPPRKECAPQWRQLLLDRLPNLQLILVIGQYAQAWHLHKKGTVTDIVSHWRDYSGPDQTPMIFPMPHPSPRNNIWLRKNPWFEAELIPVLQQQVQAVLTGE